MIQYVLLAVLLATGIEADLQCRDEDGNAVDWFVVYKLPLLSDSDAELTQTGLSYMYMTSTQNDGWTVSEREISSETSIFAQTINSMYDNSNDALWLVYNDQGTTPSSLLTSSSSSSTYGHTKGIVGGDKNGGFWLIHSVPHFPSLVSYAYPSTGHRYGQSAICVSMDAENLDLVGQLLDFNHPEFFEISISDSLKSLYPNLVEASKGVSVSSTNKTVTITSRAGTEFQGFGKSSKFGQDLYEWVAKTLQTNVYVECWINQANILSSSCDIDYTVMNIASILIEDAGVNFTTHHDHSKWAVSATSSKPWVCVGDINRAVSQEKRGGGTMCTSNEALWTAYNALIDSASEC